MKLLRFHRSFYIYLFCFVILSGSEESYVRVVKILRRFTPQNDIII